MLQKYLSHPLFKDGAASLLLKLLNLGAGTTLAIFLARALGPEGYGTYSFAFAAITILAIPTQVGLPTLLVREIAKYQLHQKWGLMRGLLLRANQMTFTLSLLLMLGVGFYVLYGVSSQDSGETRLTFLWALLLIPLVALGNLRGAILRGLRRVLMGQLPEMALRPCLILTFTVIAWSFSTLTASSTMALHVLSAALAFLVGIVLLARNIPKEVKTATARFETKIWARSVAPLSLLAGMHVLNSTSDIFLLGLLSNNENVGIYRIAIQGASLVSFGLYAVAMVVSPQFSRLYAEGKTKDLQKLVTLSARFSLLIALPICLIFILFGDWILSFIFGPAFETGATALAILCFAQLLNAMTGYVGTVLNMSGHEHYTLLGVTISALANVVLNFLLIPDYGIEGAAVATTISFALWNGILWVTARKKLGIDSSAFGFSLKNRGTPL